MARFWPWLAVVSSANASRCSLFARKRIQGVALERERERESHSIEREFFLIAFLPQVSNFKAGNGKNAGVVSENAFAASLAVLFKPFYKSQLPHKSFNFPFI